MRLTMTINIAINFLYSIFFSEVETQQKVEESKLPSHMQKKVDEITEYLKKMPKCCEEDRKNNTFPNRRGENSLNYCWGRIQ